MPQRVSDTFGATTAVRLPACLSLAAIDLQVWTLEQKKANGDGTIHRHRECAGGERLKTMTQFCQ
jgi:hypothetical protein